MACNNNYRNNNCMMKDMSDNCKMDHDDMCHHDDMCRHHDDMCHHHDDMRHHKDNMCHHHDHHMDDMPIAMCYVPWQKWHSIYDLENAFQCGTIFAELNKPFLGRCMR